MAFYDIATLLLKFVEDSLIDIKTEGRYSDKIRENLALGNFLMNLPLVFSTFLKSHTVQQDHVSNVLSIYDEKEI